MNKAKRQGKAPLRGIAAALITLGLLFGSHAAAQELPGVAVSVEFPEVGSLSISAAEVSFDLSGANYPPAEFPAYYEPVEPTEPIVLTIQANSAGWQLTASLTALIDYQTNRQIPPDQIQYSIDDSEWFSFEAVPVTLTLTPRDPTDVLASPEEHVVRLRLVVTGNEVPGSYEGTLTFSLVSQ